MVPIKSKKKKVFISFKEVDVTHHHLNFFNILKNQRLHLHYIHVFTELFHRSSMLHGTSAVVQRVDSYWRFFNYFNNLFFRNFSFRQIHCKCSKKETAFHWCFTCECNTTRASLINGLSDSVDISYEGKFW